MSDDRFPQAARRALLGCGAAAAASSLTGCAWFRRHDPVPVCPQSPEVSFPGGPLTIDAHCHVFNGTDLQVQEFFSRVAVRQGGALGAGALLLGSVLQQLAWSFAPNGDTELAELKVIAASLKTCSDKDKTTKLASLRQAGYSQGRIQLQAAVTRSIEFRVLQEKRQLQTLDFNLDADTAAKVDAIALIEGLPADVETYQALRSNKSLQIKSLRGRSIQGLIDFVLQNFQYRYVSVHDYLRTYNQPGTRVVDLMLPSMVDYDYWLAKGNGTLTPLRTQVEVMRQIAVVTGGRVHSFVPFDPLRQVAFDLKLAGEDSYSVVTDAVEKYGCVGVKLYPPMGFAALGNKTIKGPDGTNFWSRKWLPEWTNRSDMGDLLDGAMTKLLTWCQTNQVPVMAHTSLSNGVVDKFEELAGAQYWETALGAFPKLRVSFGHFGDTSLVKDGLNRSRAFTALMSNGAASPGRFAYADAGYFVEVLGKEPELRAQLRQLYEETASKGNAALANRFMYGTDWEMTLTEGSIADYLADFVRLFDQMEAGPAIRAEGISGLAAKFFGGNAVEWIGLAAGGAARNRLEAFYAKNKVPEPDWAKKVDAA